LQDRDDRLTEQNEGRAMTVATPPRNLKLEVASSLASARPTSLVHVDRKGQVRSAARYRVIQVASYSVLGATLAASAVVYGSSFGIAGVAAVGLVAAYVGWSMRRGFRLRRAALLLIHDRVEEAIPILDQIAGSRAPRRLRAMAEQNLGVCHGRRGRHEEALAHQRRAIDLYGTRRPPFAAVATQYAEIVTLVNLGRTDEAHGRFAERFPRAPEGDYLRTQHWTVELYLALAGAAVALDDADLHERARTALGMTAGGALIALTAWAHHRAGHVDQAWHLLREALDRESVPIERPMPLLHAWMQANAAAARAAAPGDA
jgi:hypothetical protein